MGIGRILWQARVRAERAWNHARGIYGQYGEDVVIDRLLDHATSGFYVDVGAYDPTLFSNTRRFYDRGWRGINIEANPVRFDRISRVRTRDINLNMGVSDAAGIAPFWVMDPDALSTFVEENASANVQAGHRLVRVEEVPVRTLAAILSEHAPGPIDFLSVDVEGHDLTVLRSNDWDRHRPRLVIVEINHAEGPIDAYLHEVGYEAVWGNGTNSIYEDARRAG